MSSYIEPKDHPVVDNTKQTDDEKTQDTKSINQSNNQTFKTLETLHFDNLVLRSVPVGVEGRRGTVFSRVTPTPLKNPVIVSLSDSALGLIDLSSETIKADEKKNVEYLAGNAAIPGSDYASHCYCGHQFGSFAGQLGDGAAMYIGEVINSHGARWEIQFKGSGLTPYSRAADGRKVLRSSVREYLCSEAMHFLGIPTTRAGSLITSDTLILRDQFYTGDTRPERASIITRIAPSFIRFGSFEICKTRDPRTGASGPCVGQTDVLRQLFDYVSSTFFSDLYAADSSLADRTTAVFTEIVHRTAKLVAQWQSIGWIHGVLNTDNMSILGVTIDYGPFAFMDSYLPDSTSNTSDDSFRYAYNRQPDICKWNLNKLAEAFSMMFGDGERASVLQSMQDILEQLYMPTYEQVVDELWHKKLGLSDRHPELVKKWFDLLEQTAGDFTNSFRILSSLEAEDGKDNSATIIDYLTTNSGTLEQHVKANEPRVEPSRLAYFIQLLASNPLIQDSTGLIPQEQARAARRTEAQNMTSEQYTARNREAWQQFIVNDYLPVLRQQGGSDKDRRIAMNSVNPKYVLRNWMAQIAIEKAEGGDYSEVNQLLTTLSDPFAVREDEKVVEDGLAAANELEKKKSGESYTCRPPKGYEQVLCSCSS